MSLKSQMKRSPAFSRSPKPGEENAISFPVPANAALSQPQEAANNTSASGILPLQAVSIAHSKKPVQEGKQKEQVMRHNTAVALYQGEMQAIRENGRVFRQKQAEKMGLSPKEIRRREALEESVTHIRIPESIDTKRLHDTLEAIHKTSKALTRWKKARPDDPLIEELQSFLSSQEATIKLLLDV